MKLILRFLVSALGVFIVVNIFIVKEYRYMRVQSSIPEVSVSLIDQEKPEEKEVSPENDWDEYIELITMNEGAKAWLKRVYRCESSGDPMAQNPSGCSGLMQFSPRTFEFYGGKNIWDGEEQLRVALIMYEIGEQHQWVCK